MVKDAVFYTILVFSTMFCMFTMFVHSFEDLGWAFFGAVFIAVMFYIYHF